MFHPAAAAATLPSSPCIPMKAVGQEAKGPRPADDTRARQTHRGAGTVFSQRVAAGMKTALTLTRNDILLFEALRKRRDDPVLLNLRACLSSIERKIGHRVCKDLGFGVAITSKGLVCIDQKLSTEQTLRYRALSIKHLRLPSHVSAAEAMRSLEAAIEALSASKDLSKILQHRGGHASWMPVTSALHKVGQVGKGFVYGLIFCDSSGNHPQLLAQHSCGVHLVLALPVAAALSPCVLGAYGVTATGRALNPDNEEMYTRNFGL